MATKKAKPATKKKAPVKLPRKKFVDSLPPADGKFCPCSSAVQRIESVLGKENCKKLEYELDLVRKAVEDCPDDCGCRSGGCLCVVFSETGEFLGELTTSAGKFSNMKLSVVGEDVLGEEVQNWQLMGLPASSEQERPVMLRDERFLDTFIDWCDANGCKTTILLEPQIDLWTDVQNLPLADEERPETIERLSRLPVDSAFEMLDRWSSEVGA